MLARCVLRLGLLEFNGATYGFASPESMASFAADPTASSECMDMAQMGASCVCLAAFYPQYMASLPKAPCSSPCPMPSPSDKLHLYQHFVFPVHDDLKTTAVRSSDAAAHAVLGRQPVLAKLLGRTAAFPSLDLAAVVNIMSGPLKVHSTWVFLCSLASLTFDVNSA